MRESAVQITLPPIDLIDSQFYFIGAAKQPVLEIYDPSDDTFSSPVAKIPFVRSGVGYGSRNARWLAQPKLPPAGDCHFQIKFSDGRHHSPVSGRAFCTPLRTLWVYKHQIFSYRPARSISPSRVEKIPAFTGSLPTRDIYVYLPRGYDQQPARSYPVIYMHDGQNCFEAFAGDSFAGSWQADLVADRLIAHGQMRECIIVGVSNGGPARKAEYLPPYTTIYPPAKSVGKMGKKPHAASLPYSGRADETLAYYRYEVAPFVNQQYRTLVGRENTATCGSSLGGLFTTYIAWERTEFAYHHAAMSPSFWITRTPQGTLETIERLRTGEPRDIRLWLDSGTLDAPGRGDDGRADTLAARNALLENGYVEGPNFQYFVDDGAVHNEAAWAGRLDKVFCFLFPQGVDHA